MRSWGKITWWGQCHYKKSYQTALLLSGSFSLTRHSEKVPDCKPGRNPTPAIKSSQLAPCSWISYPWELWENKLLLSKPQSMGLCYGNLSKLIQIYAGNLLEMQIPRPHPKPRPTPTNHKLWGGGPVYFNKPCRGFRCMLPRLKAQFLFLYVLHQE